jgi:hypothetical protein
MAGAEETAGGLMVPCADAASRAEISTRREPILARAVEDPDGVRAPGDRDQLFRLIATRRSD